MLKKLMIFVVAVGIGFSLSSMVSGETIEWTSGQLGGGWYTMSSGMAKIIMEENPGLTIKVVPGGGTANPTKVNSGRSHLGMGLDVFTFAAFNGKGIYQGKKHEKIRMIGMSFSDNYLQFIRAKGAKYDMKSFFTEAKNEALAVTKAGSSTEMTFRYVMSYYGTSYDDLRKNRKTKINHGNYSEISSQFKDRQVDYAFITLGLPGAAVIDMSMARKAEVLPITEDIRDHLKSTYGYKLGIIPAGTYKFLQKDIPTTVMGTTLITNADVSEDTVYKITKSICENQAKLSNIHKSMNVFDPKIAWKDVPAPLHPGAIKYYKEKGYM
jgi:TRAP transporter TAXI family solute receptor